MLKEIFYLQVPEYIYLNGYDKIIDRIHTRFFLYESKYYIVVNIDKQYFDIFKVNFDGQEFSFLNFYQNDKLITDEIDLPLEDGFDFYIHDKNTGKLLVDTDSYIYGINCPFITLRYDCIGIPLTDYIGKYNITYKK